MKCPRTGTEMKEIEIGGIKVDISEACGGVWFDNFEIKKFDEVHESAGEELIQLMEKYRDKHLDLSQRLKCPKDGTIMMRRFYSPARAIEIDECPQCGGIWLDAGELAMIRDMFPAEEDREAAGKAFVAEMAKQENFGAMLQESAESRRKAERFANLFRWLCPSHYIPGKQDGGAF